MRERNRIEDHLDQALAEARTGTGALGNELELTLGQRNSKVTGSLRLGPRRDLDPMEPRAAD